MNHGQQYEQVFSAAGLEPKKYLQRTHIPMMKHGEMTTTVKS